MKIKHLSLRNFLRISAPCFSKSFVSCCLTNKKNWFKFPIAKFQLYDFSFCFTKCSDRYDENIKDEVMHKLGKKVLSVNSYF